MEDVLWQGIYFLITIYDIKYFEDKQSLITTNQSVGSGEMNKITDRKCNISFSFSIYIN